MIFSSLAQSLSYDRQVPTGVWECIEETLLCRYAVAAYDNVPRWGIREREIIESILEKMGAAAQTQEASIPVGDGCRVKRVDARVAGTNPRTVYEDVIMPRAREDCAFKQGLEYMLIPSFEGAEAHEFAFSLVARLQDLCEEAILAKSDREREIAIARASRVCACANVLFEEGIPPLLVSDWGADRTTARSESIRIEIGVLKTLRRMWENAACDLRFLIGELPYCYDGLAFDVWHAETELACGEYVALRSPAWWMRPVYRLPNIHDEFPMGIAQLYRCFKRQEGIGEAFVPGPEFQEVSLTASALRGATAVLSMTLARLYFEGTDSSSPRQGELCSNDIHGLEALHREMLDKLNAEQIDPLTMVF